jgi:hypothetical protein
VFEGFSQNVPEGFPRGIIFARGVPSLFNFAPVTAQHQNNFGACNVPGNVPDMSRKRFGHVLRFFANLGSLQHLPVPAAICLGCASASWNLQINIATNGV